MEHDRGTDKGCYDTYGNETAVARQCAQQVAGQRQISSDEHRGRHQGSVTGRAKCQAGKVRHSQSDERDGAAEGCRRGREKPRNEQQQLADATYPDAEVLGIAVAEKQGIVGLDEQQGKQQKRSCPCPT